MSYSQNYRHMTLVIKQIYINSLKTIDKCCSSSQLQLNRKRRSLDNFASLYMHGVTMCESLTDLGISSN